ncbi:MAG: general secretion pathway protein GspK [Deferribacterales bacterium]
MNNKGSVLVFVLIFVAFTLGIVTFMHSHAGSALENSAGLQFEYQSSIYAMSAIEAIREVLEDDDNNYDHDGESWALIPPFPVPMGFISITVTPTNGRIPLNMLDVDNKSEAYLSGCINTLSELEIEESVCSIIKDWIDTDGEVSSLGEENIDYDTDGKTYSTKNGKLETLKELSFINGAKDHYDVLSRHFTNHGDGKLNLNFITKEALIGLVPGIAPYADSIIEHRGGNIYKDVSNIMNAASIPQDIYTTALDYLTVKSSLFYVKTEVSLNDKSRFYHVLLERNGSRTTVVKYIEGNDGVFF